MKFEQIPTEEPKMKGREGEVSPELKADAKRVTAELQQEFGAMAENLKGKELTPKIKKKVALLGIMMLTFALSIGGSAEKAEAQDWSQAIGNAATDIVRNGANTFFDITRNTASQQEYSHVNKEQTAQQADIRHGDRAQDLQIQQGFDNNRTDNQLLQDRQRGRLDTCRDLEGTMNRLADEGKQPQEWQLKTFESCRRMLGLN